MTKKIDQALGLTPLPMTLSVDTGREGGRNLVNQQQIDTDLDTARDNIHNALDISKVALEDLLMIARQSQHPKAYEALNAMIKTYADISMGITDYQLKKQKLQPNSKDDDSPTNITNNLFVGSTAELLQMMNKANNKEEE